jgi:phosphatidylinositol 3-kinase
LNYAYCLRSGKLVHIDFGYILGRDPKPLPPPMKLSKEMIEGFGGVNSEHYQAGLEKTRV